ncbi:hypothetical protein FHS19_004561 [Paenibacillus rhizosphaerae]|uniref:Uncharacterized protein n=1 Tax=Paenibacillus rhizosphaerae TaxID=297318 RepID=A0A839TSQ1_9BACL|nr:hypothetical protein [Paenibacillus rhizosphaerae]MBB3129856.1 hypothetical protein [Paenibacillus rhizosphaerae]
MGKFTNYWAGSASRAGIDDMRTRLGAGTLTTRKMIAVAFLASISALLQAMGGILPGIGFLFSPFATAPIVVSSLLSAGSGLLAYALTLLLLLFIQPSELVVFPLTTGLLALGIGLSLYYFKTRWAAVLVGSVVLCSGILLLLSVFRFPVLGPAMSPAVDFKAALLMFAFSLFYSWLWVELSMLLIRKLNK